MNASGSLAHQRRDEVHHKRLALRGRFRGDRQIQLFRKISTAALTASAYHAVRSKSRKSVAFLAVLAADALTASDKHDATARIIARIRFFFTLNTS